MTKVPLVSIIIPTYNRAHLIGETLDSVLAQTYSNWECIVVDDGSTDNTDAVVGAFVSKDPRVKYYHRPPEYLPGGNGARNYGFKMSQGAFVNWFDSDDLMLKDFIKNKIGCFSEGINLVICSGYYVSEDLTNRKRIDLELKTYLFKDYVLFKNFQIFTPSVLIRKKILLGKELFLPKITRGQEAELFSRLFFKASNSSFKIINIPLFLYRHHSETKSSKNRIYVKKYKESESYIAIENLKKSLLLEDYDLINYYYKFLINVFFRGLENDHFSNSKIVLRKLILLLFKTNKSVCGELFLLGNMLLIFKKGSYRIEKRFRKYKVLKYE